MSEIFSEVASIDYPILDADAHVNEPPDLWQSRVPARLRGRAPKALRTDKGDVWSFDDGKRLRPLGLTATAGLSYLQFRAEGFTYDTIRPGSFDPAARLADLDADGLWAQILYPSDWPNHRITIERLFRGVPAADVKKMLHTNCKTLYGLDHVPDTLA
jgi:hypothetical protein